VQQRIIDVERLKKEVRRLAAGRVLAGETADVCLDLAKMAGYRVCLTAGYGSQNHEPRPIPRDRLIWILDGYLEIQDEAGKSIAVSQGESTVLGGSGAYRLTFPQLTLYLSVEADENA
jgi:hypothetical protein